MDIKFDMDRLVWTEKERESWFENQRLPPMEPLMEVTVEAGEAVGLAEEIPFSGLMKLGIIRFPLGHRGLVLVSAKLEGEYLVKGLVGDDQEVRLVLHEPFDTGDTIELTVKNMDVAFGHVLGVRFYAED